MTGDTIVTLNVGGKEFVTRRGTLEATDSFFSALMTHSEGPNVFIDRDPTHFRHVLNYLRGSTTLPNDEAGLRELQAEADFYCLSALKEYTNDEIRRATQMNVALQLQRIAEKINM